MENGAKSFYVSDTPLQSAGGNDNFEEVALELFPGSGANEELHYFLGGATRSTSVGVELSHGVPVVRQTQTGELDFIEIRLVVSALMFQGKKDREQAVLK